MHRAAGTGKSQLCELLIEEGAEIDVVDKSGQTPLMSAVICQNKEVRMSGFLLISLLLHVGPKQGLLILASICLLLGLTIKHSDSDYWNERKSLKDISLSK